MLRLTHFCSFIDASVACFPSSKNCCHFFLNGQKEKRRSTYEVRPPWLWSLAALAAFLGRLLRRLAHWLGNGFLRHHQTLPMSFLPIGFGLVPLPPPPRLFGGAGGALVPPPDLDVFFRHVVGRCETAHWRLFPYLVQGRLVSYEIKVKPCRPTRQNPT